MRVAVTGGRGFVGGSFLRFAKDRQYSVSSWSREQDWEALSTDVDAVVHCAARVGDWGPAWEYERDNVETFHRLLRATAAQNPLIVHISSLGVHEARDHFATDEWAPLAKTALDGYTASKIMCERLAQRAITEGRRIVILRPGFIYGALDQTVLPRIIENLKAGRLTIFGDGTKLMNNTYIENLCHAIDVSLHHPNVSGQCFHITDPRLVSKNEFMDSIAQRVGVDKEIRHLPYALGHALAFAFEKQALLSHAQTAPLLTRARLKFLGLNLDFSIAKATHELGYRPAWDFRDAIQHSLR